MFRFKALFECFRFFRSENLKFRKWACFQKFRKACLSRALFRFSDVCGLRAVSDLWRQFSDWTQTWSSEKLKIWRNFFRFAIRNISIFLTEKHTGTWHRHVSGLSPCMYSRQKRFVVDLCLYAKRSIVYYCSQTHLPDFPSMNCFAYSSSEHQFWSLNSILIFSAVKQTTWEDDLLRIVTDSQCQENSNQVNLRESKGSLELV